jgi:hypothetical protein
MLTLFRQQDRELNQKIGESHEPTDARARNGFAGREDFGDTAQRISVKEIVE